MRWVKSAIPFAIVIAGMLASVSSIPATPEYGKKEKKSCTFCHAQAGKSKAEMAKNLNAVGGCYKENEHSLAKCPPAK